MNGPVSLDELLEVAVEAARVTGGHALANVGRRHEVDERTPHDVKLRLDAECQERAEAVLRQAYPAHSVFGEEGGEAELDAEYLWVVDPIDGSVNFHHGIPIWGTSVACMRRGEVVAGAVYLPVQDECYTATLQSDAQCNGERICVSETAGLQDSLLVTGLSRHIEGGASFERFGRLLRLVQKVRVCGAAVYDLCMVARGGADAYYEAALNLWDWAAAGLIVERAGGVFEIVEQWGPLRGRVIAGNPRVIAGLKDLVLDDG